MCLNAYHSEPRIAEEDITVYKVLRKTGLLSSPFRHDVYRKGETKTSTLGVSVSYDWEEEIIQISEGLHTIKFKDEAFDLAYVMYGCTVYECTIPAGTKYFIGEFNGLASYASEALVVGRRIGYNCLSDLYYRLTRQ